MTYTTTYFSPVGSLLLSATDHALTGLWIRGQKYEGATLNLPYTEMEDHPILFAACRWLDAYFSKALLPDLPPLAPYGSPFRQAVWNKLLAIPYGTVTTYGALCKSIQADGLAASPQAVGGAVGHNPISILIPCHRVVGADGSLTGYAGGVSVKEALLRLEGVNMDSLFLPKRGTAL